jgi:RHS repeat-associated protein
LDGFQYLTTAGSKPNELDPINYAYEQEAFLEESSTEHPAPELQFVPTAEGFYDFTKNEYIYQYKDHLGNVRVSYRKNAGGFAEITDQNDYYPFGMNIPREEKAVFGTASMYNYKYNGKELQETGMYDYGARMYMPDIARWGVMDPLAEQMRRHSPYNYAFNNPINFVDPDGRKPQMYNDAGDVMHWDFDPATTIEGSSWFKNSEYAPRSGFAGATMLAGSGGGDGSNTKGTPGKNSTWSSIKNFIKSIFGGNKGAGITRAGLWSLPLILKGDTSEKEQNVTLYRGVSSEAKGFLYFYASQGIAIPRGFEQVATTWGPHSDIEAHTGGDNLSIWTSWTTDKTVAYDFATGNAFYNNENRIPGIILTKQFRVTEVIPNPYTLGESEWLVPGIVSGAKIEYISPQKRIGK